MIAASFAIDRAVLKKIVTPSMNRAILAAAAIALLTACNPKSSEPSPQVEVSPSVAASPNVEPDATGRGFRYTVNQGFNVQSLSIGVGQVLVLPEGVKVGVTIRNDGTQPVDFYPDQGTSAVIDSRQLDSAPLATDGDVSGNYQPGAERTGGILFPTPEGQPIDPNEVKQIKLILGELGGSPIEIEIDLDQASQRTDNYASRACLAASNRA